MSSQAETENTGIALLVLNTKYLNTAQKLGRRSKMGSKVWIKMKISFHLLSFLWGQLFISNIYLLSKVCDVPILEVENEERK